MEGVKGADVFSFKKKILFIFLNLKIEVDMTRFINTWHINIYVSYFQ